MKRIVLILMIFSFLLNLCGCEPNTFSTEIEYYGEWDKSINQILLSSFSGSLPKKEIVNKYGRSYYYRSSQAVLGDNNFVIIVELNFPDKESLDSELSKFSIPTQTRIDNIYTYYLNPSNEMQISKYTDNEILDGMYYDFEMIFVNEIENSIKFITARVWDNYKDDVLVDCFEIIND